ncbi:uncharacterized protein MYCFIDRAFT_171769 [Pseudocercospora fijiensis CIRAD86]|uniref:Uncharacterized protein n=1 Tax=Pseudocercospora fijiensis (strain CIRAD86) TaxID=383855 RepID=M2Z821_PSEFD|nr:uncharacterized protein MYCFIDRAFT_171769 [Pseudocercospora fijiensis CIRAD86]EME85925.1 hypothetical protein MYCFIDRAFT_171769 [Pseudocercospora fijiensis CIRAD86]
MNAGCRPPHLRRSMRRRMKLKPVTMRLTSRPLPRPCFSITYAGKGKREMPPSTESGWAALYRNREHSFGLGKCHLRFFIGRRFLSEIILPCPQDDVGDDMAMTIYSVPLGRRLHGDMNHYSSQWCTVHVYHILHVSMMARGVEDSLLETLN